MPSAEQTLSPAVVHEAAEFVGAAEGCCVALEEAAEGRAGATEGETASESELGLSEGAAAAEGTTAATFSCTLMDGRAAEGIAAAGADDEGCTTGDALDGAAELSLSPEPPGTVQPIGVHSIPCTLPLPFGAIAENKSGGTSMLPNAQA